MKLTKEKVLEALKIFDSGTNNKNKYIKAKDILRNVAQQYVGGSLVENLDLTLVGVGKLSRVHTLTIGLDEWHEYQNLDGVFVYKYGKEIRINIKPSMGRHFVTEINQIDVSIQRADRFSVGDEVKFNVEP